MTEFEHPWAAPATTLPEPRRPTLALSIDEAAESLGISRRHFMRHVMPKVRVSVCGRRRLVAVAELERYLQRQAA